MPFNERFATSTEEQSPFEPTVEHFQTATEFILIAHLPGVVKEEVKVSFGDGFIKLKIIGPSDREQIARMGYYSHEVVKLYGFEKTVPLPREFDSTQTKATFKHGVLEVRVKKK